MSQPIEGTSSSDDMHSTQDSSENAQLNEVRSIRLPQPFWRDNPSRYFTVAEMTFALHRISSDETKFRYIVIHLDGDLLGIVGDIIDSPPISGKYEALKRRIIDSLSESQEAKIRRLLRGQAIGNDKPTVFLQRLRNLAGGQISNQVLRSLFVEQMPENIRGILAISQLDDLNILATQADRIFDVTRPQISSLSHPTSDASVVQSDSLVPIATSATPINSEINEINELRRSIDVLTKRFERAFRSRSRNRFRNNERSRSATPRRNEGVYCYYHQTFGAEARNCREPCSWNKSKNSFQEN